jgi:dipeptidase E
VTRLHALGWREFDVLELNGLPRQMVLERLLQADVIYAEDGNHYRLARSITLNVLAGGLEKALEDRVYVGVSAGSMTFSRNLNERSASVIGDVPDLHVLGATTLEPPLGLFDWYLKPHLYSPDFPERGDDWADRINGEEIVVSEGRWRFEP